MRFGLTLSAALFALGCTFTGASSSFDGGGEECPSPPPVPASMPGCGGPGVASDEFTTGGSDYWTKAPEEKITFDNSRAQLRADGTVNEFVGLLGKGWVDLTGARANVELLIAPDPLKETLFFFALQRDQNNAAEMVINDGMIRSRVRENGIEVIGVDMPYLPAGHRYFQMREQDERFFFEASPNGESWSTLVQTLTPTFVDRVQPMLSVFTPTLGAPPQDVPQPVNVVIDNYNGDVPVVPWCSLAELDPLDSGDSARSWLTQTFDPGGTGCTAALSAGTAQIAHNTGSQNCVARIASRQPHQLAEGQRVEVEFTASISGESPRAFLELTGFAQRGDGDPRIVLLVSEDTICASARIGEESDEVCAERTNQTRLAIGRDCRGAVLWAGDNSSLVEIARFPAVISEALMIAVGAESFGDTPAESSSTASFLNLQVGEFR